MSNSDTIAGVTTCLSSGNVTAETAFGVSPLGTARGTIGVPDRIGNTSLDGRELVLRTGVMVTGATTTNYTLGIRWQSGANTNLTTLTGDTQIFGVALPVNSVTRLLTLRINFTWAIDPVPANSRLTGYYILQGDSTMSGPAILPAFLTAGLTDASAIQFFPTGLFSVSNAGNNAVLKYCELDSL